MAHEVTLRSVTRENVRALCRLKAKAGQLAFTVAPSITIAEAAYDSELKVFAVYRGEIPVGIVALRFTEGRTIIERLFIDALSQRHGIGRDVVQHFSNETANLWVKVVNLPGSPIGFWTKVGFEVTNEVKDAHVFCRYPG